MIRPCYLLCTVRQKLQLLPRDAIHASAVSVVVNISAGVKRGAECHGGKMLFMTTNQI